MFRSVVIEVTRNCNNACRHCYNYWERDKTSKLSEAGSEGMSASQITSLIRKIREEVAIEIVALSGGEPLLRKDLPEIACELIDIGLGVTVITNGTLLTPALIRRFPEDVVFEITLFSTKEDVHNRLAGRPVMSEVLNAIAQLDHHRRCFAVAFVATRQNALDCGRTLELAAALGAQGFLYNRVNISCKTKPYLHEIVPSREMLTESLQSLDETANRLGIQVAASVPIPPCIIDPNQFEAIHFGWCPRGGQEAYFTIGYNGQMRPCNHSSVELGNPSEQGFLSLALGEKSTQFWNSFPEECKSCEHPLKQQCGGGCVAAAHEYYRSLNRIDPFVSASLIKISKKGADDVDSCMEIDFR